MKRWLASIGFFALSLFASYHAVTWRDWAGVALMFVAALALHFLPHQQASRRSPGGDQGF